MVLPYDIDRQRRLVLVTVPSPERAEEAAHLLDTLVADLRYEPGFAILFDRRAVRTPPAPAVVQAMLTLVSRHRAAFAGSRWAIAVCDDVPTAAGTLALSDALTALQMGVEVRSFLVLDDALRWLGAAPR